jgi:hypothetical protein
MTLPSPNLDDRTYADLVAEAISQIPVEYPEWTDRNPSDTGIILIELLAWLTEMTLYRVNQIPDDNYASFLSLLKGKDWNLPNLPDRERQKSLQLEIQNTLLELRHHDRAITIEDYEQLVLEDWNRSPENNDLKIARVKCLPQCNLSQFDADTFAKGHISLVVVPENNNYTSDRENVDPNLFDFLDRRRLLTTRLHIVQPQFVSITIEAGLVIQDGAQAETVKELAKAEVELFFAPLYSGKYWQGQGWIFGRSIYISELYKLLDDLEGVDYVRDLQIKDINNNSKSAIELAANQLVDIDIEKSKFTILVEVGNEYKEL